MWQIHATITKKQLNGYSMTRQVPTFFLDENIQGIISESHAIKIAKGMLNMFDDESIEVSAYANKLSATA